jgi:hypothetical protein
MFSLGTKFCYESEQELVLQPWEDHPHQLISWLEMLEFSAQMFFFCGRALRNIMTDCLIGSIPGTGEEPTFYMFRLLDDKAKDRALPLLEYVEAQFRKVGLQITADTVNELANAIREPPQAKTHNFQWLMDQILAVEKLAAKELKGKAFFYIPAERLKFYPKVNDPHIFGDAVATAFPSASYDIAESGVCLSLDRGTASVFHLMRVLEIGLTVLGATFGLSLAHTNWAPAIEQIEKQIRDMYKDPAWKALPDCKERQEFYAQAATHFGVLKDAWRNYTMHARGFYTEEQAEQIFRTSCRNSQHGSTNSGCGIGEVN